MHADLLQRAGSMSGRLVAASQTGDGGRSAAESSSMNPFTESANPLTSSSRLRELAQDSSELVRRRVAGNPSTPIDILFALLEDPDCWVAWNLAQNRAASPELLIELAARRLFLEKVASNHRSPGRLLAQLAREPDQGIREAVAVNPMTPASVLEELAGASELRVRWCVARNTSAAGALLERLASDSEEKVRQAVARNRNTPAATKRALKQKLGYR